MGSDSILFRIFTFSDVNTFKDYFFRASCPKSCMQLKKNYVHTCNIYIFTYTLSGQTVQSAIRCYGTGWVMDESCPANHKIFPVEVRVGSLALSTGCPDNIVKGTDPTQESNCCTTTDSGCIDTYRNTQNGSVTYVYHENCMGRQSCISFSVVRSTTTGPVVYCDQSLYHSTTTVLEMRYQCIEGMLKVGNEETSGFMHIFTFTKHAKSNSLYFLRKFIVIYKLIGLKFTRHMHRLVETLIHLTKIMDCTK